nr:unnamed protein product [Trichobilharzia regenti]
MEIKVGDSIRIEDGFYVPEELYMQYKKMNISSIFSWQAECLRLPGVLEGNKNLVYSAPTSAGKTLVAELIVLKRVLESSLKAFIILPYVSVSREKMTYLQRLFSSLGIRVGGYMGGQSPPGGLSAINVAVCTIEKANSLVNRLIEEDRLDELGIVVVDELHLIGDTHRGYLLELLLTKLLLHSRRRLNAKLIDGGKSSGDSQSLLNGSLSQSYFDTNGIQVVGMSATLPNLATLGQWLDAEVYVTKFRPVPLTELILSCDTRSKVNQFYKLVNSNVDSVCTQQKSECLVPTDNLPLDPQLTSDIQLNDEDGVFGLCLDSFLNGHGVLVFCPTKQWCEQLADTMARQIFSLTQSYFSAQRQQENNTRVLRSEDPVDSDPNDYYLEPDIGVRLASRLDRVGLTTCVEQLRRCPAGLDTALARCLGYGVAFHHAGLTIEEREVIEFGFRKGLIRILIATSTLSSGVNLPARRVIIRTPLFHGHILDYLTYKQMAGRAGRQGVDTSGQSILLCKPKDLGRVRQLVMNGMPPVNSCLMGQGGSPESSLKRALLEVIANGFVETLTDALLYLSSTLLATVITQEKLTELKSPKSSHHSPGGIRRRSLRLSQSRISSSGEVSCVTDNNNEFISEMKRLLFLCIKDLQKQELIYIDQSSSPEGGNANLSQMDTDSLNGLLNYARLQPTALGRAVLSSSLGPVHGLVVFEELDRARRSIALDTELHLIYLLTPVYLDVGADLDWLCYLEQYQSLSPAERRVADLVDIEERFITRCAAGASSTTSGRFGNASMTSRRLSLHRRFYTALVLYRLVNEDGLQAVAKKFGVNRGLLQSLQQQAATYAGMVTIFCNRLGWSHMERIIANFQSRLCYGVSEELVDLIRLLPLVNAERARALYAAGYTSISSLATARSQDISRVLQRAIPFERKKSSENSAKASCRTILLDDGNVINEQEAAPLIIQQAKRLLEIDLASVYGKDLVILSKEDEKVMQSKENMTIADSPVHQSQVLDKTKNTINELNSSQLILENTISSRDMNVNGDHSGNLDSAEDRKRSSSSVGEDHEAKRQKAPEENVVLTSVMSATTTASSTTVPTTTNTSTNSTMCTELSFGSDDSISDDYRNNTGNHTYNNEEKCASSQKNSTDCNVDHCEDQILTFKSQVLDVQCNKSTHLQDTMISKDFENFTQPSQSFILTSQLAAIVDNQISIVNNTKTENSVMNVSVSHCTSVQACSEQSESSTLSSSLISCDNVFELNDTLTFSMFESSFPASKANSNNNNNDNNFNEDASKQNEELTVNFDSQILQNFMMSQITFDTEYEDKQKLVSPSQPPGTKPSISINEDDTALGTERKSVGDLFNSSFTFDLSANKQSQDSSSCCQNRNFGEAFRCKANTVVLPTDVLPVEVVKTGINNINNGGDDDEDDYNCDNRDDLFSIIDVTQSYFLWKTFLDDLYKRIDEISKQNSTNSNYIAVQPGWSVNMNCPNQVDTVNGKDSLECLIWRSGPGGYPATGGGRSMCIDYNLYLSGLSLSSVCLRSNVVFWIDFVSQNDVNRVPVSKCLADIRDLFIYISHHNIGLILWDVKWWYRIVYDLFKLPFGTKFQIYNPNLVNWLKNQDLGQSSLLNEAKKLSANTVDLLSKVTSFAELLEPPTQFSDWSKIPNLILLNQCPPANHLNGQQLSCLPDHINITAAQCFLLALWTNMNSYLSEVDHSILSSIEMPCQSLLAKMESHGFNLNIDELIKCHDSLTHACKQLESVAHRLAGLPFPMDSPKEISKVLFKWLHLPQISDPKDTILTRKRNQQALLLNGRKQSVHLPRATNAVLSKLTGVHPLPAIIIEWRHLNGILEKIFNSLVSTCRNCISDREKPLRVSPIYDVYTATGRIISTMPNLQSVPKDITIEWPKLLYKSLDNSQLWPSPFDKVLAELPEFNEIIKPRRAFLAPPGSILISADFCQLELRLLAHFSKDAELLKLLSVDSSSHIDQSMAPKSESDAFKKLAAHWLNIPHLNQVTDVHRQQAKQLCYAILYGMGAQTLASQLNIPEQNAQKLIDSFLHTYSGVQKFITATIASAHHDGQIKTLNGHIRLLPALTAKTLCDNGTNHEFDFSRSKKNDFRHHFAVVKAERQAVNSMIQGSAAEIAKLAMLAVDEALNSSQLSGYANLVLHEHDELIYEVS